MEDYFKAMIRKRVAHENSTNASKIFRMFLFPKFNRTTNLTNFRGDIDAE